MKYFTFLLLLICFSGFTQQQSNNLQLKTVNDHSKKPKNTFDFSSFIGAIYITQEQPSFKTTITYFNTSPAYQINSGFTKYKNNQRYYSHKLSYFFVGSNYFYDDDNRYEKGTVQFNYLKYSYTPLGFETGNSFKANIGVDLSIGVPINTKFQFTKNRFEPTVYTDSKVKPKMHIGITPYFGLSHWVNENITLFSTIRISAGKGPANLYLGVSGLVGISIKINSIENK